MCNRIERIGTMMAASLAASVLVSGLALPELSYAQSQPGARIVCWKDKSGKTVGCGDKVPPEYQDAATREIDRRGVTRGQTESVEEAKRRREKEQETAKSKAEDERKALDQRRQDMALLETFSSEKEIDLKRDRDIAVIDSQIEQMTLALKNTTARYNDLRTQADVAEKNKKPMPEPAKAELTRVTGDKQRYETSLQAKQKEKEALRARYAEMRTRYTELRAASQPASTASTKK